MRTIGVKLMADAAGLKAGFRDASTSVRGFTAELDKAARARHLNAVADQAARMGLVAAGAFGAVIKTTADFEKAMSGVSAATHAGARDMELLRAAALQAGKDTSFSATEAAKAVTELSKAGVTTAQILGGGLKGALSLAAAGQMDVADAAEVAASAMTQFKLNGSQIPHVADLLAAGAGKAQGSVHDMSMALNQGGLVAAQMGMSIEETTGTLAAFAGAGLLGSDAGTSLKTMLLMLANPSKKAANTMKELGINAYDAAGNFVGTTKLAGQLQQRLSGLTQEQRNAALATIFGSDAIRAASVLYQDGAKGVADWTGKVNEQGYAVDTAAKQTDNLVGDIERLKGSLETLAIESGSGATSGLRVLTKGTEGLVNQLDQLPPAVGGTITVLAGLGGATLLAGAGWVKMRHSSAAALEELRATGPAGTRAATALQGTAKWAGRAGLAFAALQLAGAAVNAFMTDLNPQIEAATGGLQAWNRQTQLGGEAARIFGKDGQDLTLALTGLSDHGFSHVTDNITDFILGVGGVASPLDDARQKADAFSQSLAAMVQAGHADQAAALVEEMARRSGKSVGEITKLLPAYTGAVEVAGRATTGAAGAIDGIGGAASTAAADVQKLNDAFDDLFDIAMSGDRLQIKLADSIKAVNKELTHGTRTLSLNSDEGKRNRTAILDRIDLLKEARDQQIKEGGATAEATAAANKNYNKNVSGLRRAALAAGFNEAAVNALIGKYNELGGKKAQPKISTPGAKTAKTAVDNLATAIEGLPPGNVHINVDTGGAQATLAQLRANITALGGTYIAPGPHPKARKNRDGGMYTPMASGGLRDAAFYPAGSSPLYQFAEPETGGEWFLPLKGDKKRGQQLLALAAAQYDGAFVPMAVGGWRQHAGTPSAVTPMLSGGLVNVAPSSAPNRSGSRLASDEAYLSARDAVVSLNRALKDNGRWMTESTAKGRENRSELNSAIRAAQSAAQAKYDETGSVKAANAAYDAHIARLRAVLRQQHVNAATIKALLGGLAARPSYDTSAARPSNSSATIAFVKDQMGLADATTTARGFFDKSWGKPVFSTNTPGGRDNLTALFAFLDQAGQAAQSRFTQTGSAKTATALYNTSLATLRGILTTAGMSKKEIDNLLGTYGRITLGNRMGGVYEHAQTGLLRDAHIAPAGPTRYAYAEKATGGEAFIPRTGDLDRSRSIWGYVGQNWLGMGPWQRGATTAPAPDGGMTIRVLVNDGAVSDLVDVHVEQAFGALADAHIYQTAG